MSLSILPLFVLLLFVFSFLQFRKAKLIGTMSVAEIRGVYLLLSAFLLWVIVVVYMGIREMHLALMQEIPWLWQAFVPVTIWIAAVLLFGRLRGALAKIAIYTPLRWFLFLQALRIGALGGVLKGIDGEITSTYVFWIGVPDFLFGVSALLLGIVSLRRKIGSRFLIAWNLIGFSLIFFPTFGIMLYWMTEPGFEFIFEFPMILAPAIVVPLFISFNLMHAWALVLREKSISGAEVSVGRREAT
ncbi:MAG: hypothetical protein KZQ93_08580 [Candidatus Thiodiazotropha sp. (ex Monitilora ramsayi)]|nr:hypothetical protein [Candidatus Thiodiazotropha sp. (ex Monitilora ramsayi)]